MRHGTQRQQDASAHDGRDRRADGGKHDPGPRTPKSAQHPVAADETASGQDAAPCERGMPQAFAGQQADDDHQPVVRFGEEQQAEAEAEPAEVSRIVFLDRDQVAQQAQERQGASQAFQHDVDGEGPMGRRLQDAERGDHSCRRAVCRKQSTGQQEGEDDGGDPGAPARQHGEPAIGPDAQLDDGEEDPVQRPPDAGAVEIVENAEEIAVPYAEGEIQGELVVGAPVMNGAVPDVPGILEIRGVQGEPDADGDREDEPRHHAASTRFESRLVGSARHADVLGKRRRDPTNRLFHRSPLDRTPPPPLAGRDTSRFWRTVRRPLSPRRRSMRLTRSSHWRGERVRGEGEGYC